MKLTDDQHEDIQIFMKATLVTAGILLGTLAIFCVGIFGYTLAFNLFTLVLS